MQLQINPPSNEQIKANGETWYALATHVTESVRNAGVDVDSCDCTGDRYDPFVVDVAVKNSKLVTRDIGIKIAVDIQNKMRLDRTDGWVVRFWIQPESDELVLDFVIWLEIDSIRIEEYQGRRHMELFKTISDFRKTVWNV